MAPVGFSGEEVGHSRVVCTKRCLVGIDVENDPLKCETLKINQQQHKNIALATVK